jgi:1-deoxyxylulose-5-phosphate synthase
MMEYVNLGHSGLKVSRICLGTLTFGSPKWRSYILDETESRPIIQRALELGINFVDTADMYSIGVSEEVVGRALRDFTKRDKVVLATKVYFAMSDDPNDRGLSRKHIMDSVDGSLRRLGTDYIDLYQIHRWDYETPLEETLEALHDLVKAGKVRYIGASSMYAWQFARCLYTADLFGWQRFISMQNHFNLVYREEQREMLPLCEAEGVGVIPWSPLARGFLAGNRSREGGGATERAKDDPLADEMYYRPSDFDVVERVVDLAGRKGVNPAQIALAWLLHQPAVTAPIVGVRKLGHLEEMVAALDINLTVDECAFLEAPYQPHPVLGHD